MLKLICTTWLPHGDWTVTTERVWYIFHSCGNCCGTHMYNRCTTRVPQENFKIYMYHRITTQCLGPLPQNVCGIFFIPVVISVVLTCTTGVPHKYHTSTTGHFCKGLTSSKKWYIFKLSIWVQRKSQHYLVFSRKSLMHLIHFHT